METTYQALGQLRTCDVSVMVVLEHQKESFENFMLFTKKNSLYHFTLILKPLHEAPSTTTTVSTSNHLLSALERLSCGDSFQLSNGLIIQKTRTTKVHESMKNVLDEAVVYTDLDRHDVVYFLVKNFLSSHSFSSIDLHCRDDVIASLTTLFLKKKLRLNKVLIGLRTATEKNRLTEGCVAAFLKATRPTTLQFSMLAAAHFSPDFMELPEVANIENVCFS